MATRKPLVQTAGVFREIPSGDFVGVAQGGTGLSLGGLGTGILKNTTITGALSIAVAGDFPALPYDAAGAAAAVTPTTLGLVIGTNVQAYAANLTTWAGKPPYAGTLTITTGSTLAAGTGGTLGTAAYTASTAYDAAGAAAAVTPTTLGLVIGTNVQAYNAKLGTFSALADAAGWLHSNGSAVYAWSTPSKSDVGLSAVENTALSTWAGTTHLVTLGTVTTGVWHGTAIADTYISSAAAWTGKQAAYANLTTIGALANGTGWLHDDGSGVFAYSTPTAANVGALSTALTSAHLLVGNASNVATDAVMSGDVTITGFSTVLGVSYATTAIGANKVTLAMMATIPNNTVLGNISGGGAVPSALTHPNLAGLTLTDLAALTTAAESWVGPSSTAGIYFKGGNVGIGTTAPTSKLHIISQDATYPALYLQGWNAGFSGLSQGLFVLAGFDKNDYAFKVQNVRSDLGAHDAFIINGLGNVFIGKTTGNSKFGITGLPTSASGLAYGDIWCDTTGGLNILKIV